MDQEAAQAREYRHSRERQYLEDLAAVAQSPQGARFLAAMLRNHGIGRPLAEGAADTALHNAAMIMLEQLARSSPRETRDILAMIYNLK